MKGCGEKSKDGKGSYFHKQGSEVEGLPPPSGAVKINFNGAIFPKEKKSGIEVVIRDTRSLIIASCSKVMHQVLGVSNIEALAAAWAFSFAFDVGVRRAILEGDSLAVISDLREDGKQLYIPSFQMTDETHIRTSEVLVDEVLNLMFKLPDQCSQRRFRRAPRCSGEARRRKSTSRSLRRGAFSEASAFVD
ncbi:hypothetical protein SO802_008456 [Lithocarpus litseifolius]|uniref:RNase H type-1 domain-containing protein n=1 Tax=Lithocarpus litseifolius TaxID=425828 RepID=A0AAW2DBI3_9ROSI